MLYLNKSKHTIAQTKHKAHYNECSLKSLTQNTLHKQQNKIYRIYYIKKFQLDK